MIYERWSMNLSSSSKPDPLSDVLGVLRAKITRCTRMEAAGRWALAFPAIDRLKFVAILRGSAWMVRPGSEPHLLRKGDVCLIGRTAYIVASHPAETPIDGQAFYPEGCDVAKLGGNETIGIGGRLHSRRAAQTSSSIPCRNLWSFLTLRQRPVPSRRSSD
jgi:hypothetical protein